MQCLILVTDLLWLCKVEALGEKGEIGGPLVITIAAFCEHFSKRM